MIFLKRVFFAIKNFYFPKDSAEHHRIKVSIARIFITLAVTVFSFVSLYLAPTPKVLPLNAGSVKSVPIDKELQVRFTAPVKRDEVVATITPETRGEWSWGGDILGSGRMYTVLVFKPLEAYKLDTDYVVDIRGVRRVVGIGGSKDVSLSFRTMKTPLVSSVSPADKAVGVRADEQIVVTLDSPNKDIVEYAVKFEPDVPHDMSYNGDQTSFTLAPRSSLVQGQLYKMSIIRTAVALDLATNKVALRGEPEIAREVSFTVAAPPGIESFNPSGNMVLTSARDITIVFNQDMDRASVEQNFSSEPALAGQVSWSSDRQLTYRYETALGYATKYSFIVKSGTKNKNGGFLPADATASFTTIGSIYVAYFTPANGSSGNGVGTSISVGFDQEVDHSSAQSKFSLSGVSGGQFGWSGNIMKYYPPGPLSKDSGYTISIAAGVKSVSGLDSARAFSSTFYTEETVVKLAIPLDYQDRALSCELASLKMALNYKGAGVGESDILARLSYNPSPRVGNIWGNPYVSFVGNIDGAQNSTGYGVYWGPIATAGATWRPTQAVVGLSAAQMAAEIAAGNPIVIWGTAGNAYYDPWQTSDGQKIDAWKGEHARTLIGFVGPVSNPRQFIVNDPIFGQRYWSTSALLGNMSAFGNAGVVVR